MRHRSIRDSWTMRCTATSRYQKAATNPARWMYSKLVSRTRISNRWYSVADQTTMTSW
ncbi:hypothetical protein PPTG_23573 [Phytophthora nicotianae INRA-310]|uniref:Uncharacterized protein n=1 Tax=Phytophthora nicotianae (strain INRA-310) TaxID=761204 RepID=W2PUJ7_PHYN3|nr:hypothetical protein PPTG_23573 [Phytophthora nicotianae INRA-310]ETN04612.1 hypothetical protein PPTG_23573 [Phytophthora nicotianae INRA-310]